MSRKDYYWNKYTMCKKEKEEVEKVEKELMDILKTKLNVTERIVYSKEFGYAKLYLDNYVWRICESFPEKIKETFYIKCLLAEIKYNIERYEEKNREKLMPWYNGEYNKEKIKEELIIEKIKSILNVDCVINRPDCYIIKTHEGINNVYCINKYNFIIKWNIFDIIHINQMYDSVYESENKKTIILISNNKYFFVNANCWNVEELNDKEKDNVIWREVEKITEENLIKDSKKYENIFGKDMFNFLVSHSNGILNNVLLPIQKSNNILCNKIINIHLLSFNKNNILNIHNVNKHKSSKLNNFIAFGIDNDKDILCYNPDKTQFILYNENTGKIINSTYKK